MDFLGSVTGGSNKRHMMAKHEALLILLLVISLVIEGTSGIGHDLTAARAISERVCRRYEWLCKNQEECIPFIWRCDGMADCMDGSDEAGCRGRFQRITAAPTIATSPSTCRRFEWPCKNQEKCIPNRWRCDRAPDCTDRSDEHDCGYPAYTERVTTASTAVTSERPTEAPTPQGGCPKNFILRCYGRLCNDGEEVSAGYCSGSFEWDVSGFNSTATILFDVDYGMQLCVNHLHGLVLHIAGGQSLGNGSCTEGSDGEVILIVRSLRRSGMFHLVGFDFEQGASPPPSSKVENGIIAFLTEQNTVLQRPEYCAPVNGCAIYALPAAGECCQKCRQMISVCPGVECPPVPRCIRYARKAEPGKCCIRCTRWRKRPRKPFQRNACEPVQCPTGRVCANKDGTAQCICKTCRKRLPRVPVCGTDGKTYRHICKLHEAKCKQCKPISLHNRGGCVDNNRNITKP